MTLVDIRGLTKRYGHVPALQGIDLCIEEGEIFGLLGPNGAGKTTTVEILAGLRSRDGGEVRVLGLDPGRERDRLVKWLALQPQRFDFLDNVTVDEMVRFYAALYGVRDRHRLERLLERLGLSERRTARFHHLSGGQRQRLSLVLTLLGDPKLVILDEPTTGLDPQARHQIHDLIQQIRAEGRTVLLTTHYLEEAERLCDRVAIMDHGKVLACEAPHALINRFGGQTRVEVSYTGNPTGIDALPGVVRTLREDSGYIYWSVDVNATLNAIFTQASERGVAIERMEIRPPTLEDVFLQLTGRHFRD